MNSDLFYHLSFWESPWYFLACSPARLLACSPARLLACSPARLLACSFLALVGFISVPEASHATEWPNELLSDCALDPSSLVCTTYVEEFKVFLPGYPGCPVWVRAQVRECTDPNGSLLPIIEYVVERVYFDTPNDINDPNDPCYAIHQDYVSSGGSITAKVAFVRSLLSQSIDAVALSYFSKWYTFDSVAYLIDPSSEAGRRYLERKCENGQQFFRAIQASCLQSFIRDDCDYPETGIEANGDGKEATAAYDPTFTTIPCRYVRYEPCSVNGPCCIEEIKICRKPSPFIGHDEITEVTKTTQVVGSTGDICEELPGTTVLPGETKTECYIYCENEPPESFHPTQPNPSGDKVKLSREDLDARK